MQYAGPAIDISYPVLYPPPPSAPAPEETMNILIQRVPTRGFKKDKEAKTGANRFEDEGNLKQKYRVKSNFKGSIGPTVKFFFQIYSLWKTNDEDL